MPRYRISATGRKSLVSKERLETKVSFSGSSSLEEPMWPTINDGDEHQAPLKLLADRLARETGISEDEAERLIKLIGTDWNSLLREAKFLKGRH
ncbi:hypothetical protein [Mesorhizobium sp. 131-2-1]|uniref:hypothetical protein n=1 Tax=Mesorhizobium sp. 131-2-1 TaxID=2744518 RepID=UPI0019251F77|nr:hypothetical protein [Mesorhizobium sp. 131-2-1]